MRQSWGRDHATGKSHHIWNRSKVLRQNWNQKNIFQHSNLYDENHPISPKVLRVKAKNFHNPGASYLNTFAPARGELKFSATAGQGKSRCWYLYPHGRENVYYKLYDCRSNSNLNALERFQINLNTIWWLRNVTTIQLFISHITIPRM